MQSEQKGIRNLLATLPMQLYRADLILLKLMLSYPHTLSILVNHISLKLAK
jgi:hypothetical protein